MRPYRGNDRRAGSDWRDTSLGPFVAAGAGLVGVLALFSLGPVFGEALDVVDVWLLRMQLDGATVAVACLAGALCLVRWRVAGEAAAMWLGTALLVFGVATVGFGTLLTATEPGGIEAAVLAAAHPASRVAVLWLLYRALRAPMIDAGVRPWHALLAAGGVTAALTVAFQLMPSVGPLLASSGDLLVADGNDVVPAGAFLLVMAWVSFGAVFGFRGVRTRRWLHAWFGLMLFAFAFTELLRTQEHAATSLWLAAPNTLRFVGVLFAAVGATRELIRAFQEQQLRLLETVESEKSKEARLQAEQRALEEMAHEARNALTAIEGATRTLEHYRDRLDDSTRAGLTEAVSQEIARLQTLVSPDRLRPTAGEFRLLEMVTPIVTAARSADMTVQLEVPDNLVAFGYPAETGQVVQNLIENARRYAPGSPIYLRAQKAPGGVVLRVEDTGPGVPQDERRSIFERGYRGSTSSRSDGTGLGLYVSARLMREQGGDLWVEPRQGGGASFALWLPTRPESTLAADDFVDEAQHAVQGAHLAPLNGSRRPQDANGAVVRVGRDDEHDIRTGTRR